jgi:hypothetical protein
MSLPGGGRDQLRCGRPGPRTKPWEAAPSNAHHAAASLSLVGNFVRGRRWDCVWQHVVRQQTPRCRTRVRRANLAVSSQGRE